MSPSELGQEATIFLLGEGWVLAAILLGGLIIATIRRPALGIAGVLASLPLYQVRGEIAGFPTTFLELALLSVVGVIVLKYGRLMLRRSGYEWPLALWVGGALGAALLSADVISALGLWRAWFFEPVLFFYAALAVWRRDDPARRSVLWGLLGSGAVILLWTTGLALTGEAITYDNRLTGPFQSPNFLAMALVLIMVVLLFWPERRLLFSRAVILGGSLVALTLASSRGGLLALSLAVIVGILFRPIRHSRPSRSKVWPLAALGLVISVFLVLVVGSLFTGERNDRLSSRPAIWQHAVAEIQKDPLWGVGPTRFQQSFFEVKEREADVAGRLYIAPQARTAHNVALSTWTEWGLMSLLGFLALVVTVARKTLQVTRPTTWRVSLVLVTAILVHGLIDTTVLKNDLALLFVLTLALSVPATQEPS